MNVTFFKTTQTVLDEAKKYGTWEDTWEYLCSEENIPLMQSGINDESLHDDSIQYEDMLILIGGRTLNVAVLCLNGGTDFQYHKYNFKELKAKILVNQY